jgi:hypothetical protein
MALSIACAISLKPAVYRPFRMIPAEERRKVPPEIEIRKNFLSTVFSDAREQNEDVHGIFKRGKRKKTRTGTAALYRRARGNA